MTVQNRFKSAIVLFNLRYVKTTGLAAALLLAAVGMPVISRGQDGSATNRGSTITRSDGGTSETDGQRLRELDRLIGEGRYRSAEEHARATLSALNQGGTGSSLTTVLTLERLLEVLLRSEKGKTPEALEVAQRAVTMRKAQFGRRSPETALSLMLLGRVYTDRQEFSEAETALRDALEVTQATLGSDHLQAADARYFIGRLYMAKGQHAEARDWIEQALAIREKSLGPDSLPVAQALTSIGDCIASGGNFRDAIPILRRAVAISERLLGPDHPELATSLGTLGTHLRNDGDYSEASIQLERMLRIYEATFGPDSPRVSSPLAALAPVYSELGVYSRAQPLFERALSVRLKAFGANDPRVASVQNNFATMYIHMHSYQRALELLEAAAQVYESTQGPWSGGLANCLNNEGIVLRETGQHEQAIGKFIRATEIFTRRDGADSANVAMALNNLAMAQMDGGGFIEARVTAEKTLSILEKDPDHNRPTIVESFAILALANQALGNGAEAIEFSNRRLALATTLYGASHPEVAVALIDRASLLAELGRSDEAVRDAVAGETISRENLMLTARSSAEPMAVAYAAHRESGLELLVTMATQLGHSDAGIVAAAADAVVRGRALVLDALVGRGRNAFESRDPETGRLLMDLQRASDQLSNLIVRGPRDSDSPPYPEALVAAREGKERAERALAAHSAEFRWTLALSDIGMTQVRETLPKGNALVAFVRYNSQDIVRRQIGKPPGRRTAAPSYAAFVLTSSGAQPSFVRLGDAASIEASLQRWHKGIVNESLAAGRQSQAAEAIYRKVATELRRWVWDPIVAQLGDAKQVLIVPDGALNLVTFAALPIGEARYLVEEGRTFHYLSAERDLLTPGKASSHGGLLSLSNPDFDDRRLFAALGAPGSRATPVPEETTASVFRGARSACGSFQSMRFEALPASLLETKEVARIWDDQVKGNASLRSASDAGESAVSFTGPAANETMFKHTASEHRVLHLATHGFFLGGDCESALDSPAADGTSSASSAATRENPLLLSGLVFAGANHRDAAGPNEDDGILTAQEIATLDLQGTEWAVLSACDTGAGEIRGGEGVFGLRRAFQLAGARTVIMSLWPVEDEATRLWMTALYRHRFVEGKSTAASVNGASLELLQQRRARGESTHPFYWAGFIAAGDWR